MTQTCCQYPHGPNSADADVYPAHRWRGGLGISGPQTESGSLFLTALMEQSRLAVQDRLDTGRRERLIGAIASIEAEAVRAERQRREAPDVLRCSYCKAKLVYRPDDPLMHIGCALADDADTEEAVYRAAVVQAERQRLREAVEALLNKWDTPDAGVYALSSALGYQTCRAEVLRLLAPEPG